VRPRSEEPNVVQRSQSAAEREQDVLEHVFGVGALIKQRRESRCQELLCDRDESLEMNATSGLRPQHQPGFVGR
jgi:hypothetical protein